MAERSMHYRRYFENNKRLKNLEFLAKFALFLKKYNSCRKQMFYHPYLYLGHCKNNSKRKFCDEFDNGFLMIFEIAVTLLDIR